MAGRESTSVRLACIATTAALAADGTRRTVPAALEGGLWVAAEPLAAGERAVVARGAVQDRFGNYNGEASA